jgi:hypothetical protein
LTVEGTGSSGKGGASCSTAEAFLLTPIPFSMVFLESTCYLCRNRSLLDDTAEFPF